MTSDGYTMIIKLGRESFEKKHPTTVRGVTDQVDTFSEREYHLDAWQRRHSLMSLSLLFEPLAVSPHLSNDDCFRVKFEGSAATTVRHWNSGPHVGDGMEPPGKKCEKL
jgi:cephalosporin-C deacetylase-like acetyl esterase